MYLYVFFSQAFSNKSLNYRIFLKRLLYNEEKKSLLEETNILYVTINSQAITWITFSYPGR